VIEILHVIEMLFSGIHFDWWVGFVLIGLPIIYVVGMTVTSIFLYKWFRKNQRKVDDQKLKRYFQISFIDWILFLVLLPIALLLMFFNPFIFIYLNILPGIAFILFLIYLILFKRELSNIKEMIEEPSMN